MAAICMAMLCLANKETIDPGFHSRILCSMNNAQPPQTRVHQYFPHSNPTSVTDFKDILFFLIPISRLPLVSFWRTFVSRDQRSHHLPQVQCSTFLSGVLLLAPSAMRFTTAILLLLGAGTLQAAAVPAPAAAYPSSLPTLEERGLHDAKPKPNPAKVEKEEDCDCNEDVFGAIENVVRDNPKQAPLGQAPNKGSRPEAPKPKSKPSSSDKPSPKSTSHRLEPTHTQAPAKHVSEHTTTAKPSTTVAPTPNGPVVDFTEWVTVKVTSTTTLGKRDFTVAAADSTPTVDANSDNDDSPVVNPSSLAWGDYPPDPDDNDNNDAITDPDADPSPPSSSKPTIEVREKRNWDDKIYTTDVAQFIKWKNLQPLGSNPGTSVKRHESEVLKLSTIANLHRMDGYLQGSDACSSSDNPSSSTKRGMLDGLSRLEAFFEGLHHKRDANPGIMDGLTRLLNFFEGRHHKRQDPSSTASSNEENPATEAPSEEQLATYKVEGYTAALTDCPTASFRKRNIDTEISRLASAYMADGGFVEKRTASSPCKVDRASNRYKCTFTGHFYGRDGVRIFCTAPFPLRKGDEKSVECREVMGKGS